MDSLPLELIAVCASKLNCRDYLSLRAVCRQTANLDLFPTLTFSTFKESRALLKKSCHSKIKLCLDDIDDTVLEYLVKEGNVQNYMRIFDLGRANSFSDQAKEAAFNEMLQGKGTQQMLMPLLDDSSGVDLFANENFAIRECAKMGYNQAIAKLLELGADVHANSDEALKSAVQVGAVETVNILLLAGANPYTLDDEALYHAIEYGWPNIVECLLYHGVDPTIHNNLAIRLACVCLFNKGQWNCRSCKIAFVGSPSQPRRCRLRRVNQCM